MLIDYFKRFLDIINSKNNWVKEKILEEKVIKCQTKQKKLRN